MNRSARIVAGILTVLLTSAVVHASLVLVENFDGMATGSPDGDACTGALGGTWDTETANTGNVTVEDNSGSRVVRFMTTTAGDRRGVGFNGISNPIDDGETGKVFFRFMLRSDSQTPRTYLGLISDTSGDPVNSSNVNTPTNIPVGFGLLDNGSGGYDLVRTDGTTVLKAGLARTTWYNCWIVADNAADTFAVYLSEAAGPAGEATLPNTEDLVAQGIPFGVATGVPLTGMVFGCPSGDVQSTRTYIDEIWWDGDQGLTAPAKATGPSPSNGASDVPQDAVLSWTPVASAVARNVYFGTSLADVSAADSANPLGVLAQADLDVNTYDPPDLLEFGQTYYWRVDEVNATDGTVFTGSVWSFTVEPYAYPLTGILATASSVSVATTGPEKTIDGSGLDADDLHGTDSATMWLSDGTAPRPAWIGYEFDAIRKLDRMQVWNSNQIMEAFAGVGARDVTAEYSTDGIAWTTLAGVPEFAKAPGAPGYASNTTVEFGGVAAKYVRLTINSNWGGLLPQFGLSEVRFYYVPVRAREPQPASGRTDVDPSAVVLSWRPGREAASHQVYLSTDSNAVADGTAPMVTTAQAQYVPPSLELGRTYYWKVVEVDEAETPGAWESEIWSLSTTASLPIDDFEAYTNDSPNRVFQTWIDGLGFSPDAFFPDGNPGNGTGAVVGYDPALGNIMETGIARGRQSMPLSYDNTGTKVSEAQRTWPKAQNWVADGADTLMLYFQGNPIGFLETAEGHILMNGIGADIYGTSDQGRFVYRQLSGDGAIIACVERIDAVDPWSKAGVMIRRTLEGDAPWAMAVYAPGNGFRLQTRATLGGAGGTDSTVATAEQIAVRAPVWIKLERVGNQFNGYYATAEAPNTWIASPWGAQTIEMGDPVYIGLAVTSHAAAAVTQAEFSNITTTGNVTGSWQSVDLGIEQPVGNMPDPLYVTLEDTDGNKATVVNPDPYAVGTGVWTPWDIPLAEFSSRGVKTDSVKKMSIGIGDSTRAASGAVGIVYIDDISYGRPASAQ